MPVITISRGSLSGGEELARRLQSRLGYELISREVLIEAAGRYGLTERALAEGLEEPAGLWQRLTHAKAGYLLAIKAALAEHIERGSVIYHGHAGQFLLAGLPGVIKVRLIAPEDYRVRAAIARYGMSREEALAHIEAVDAKRSRWVRQVYDVDINECGLYDLVINLAHVDVETAAATVADLAHSPEFRSSSARERELQDFAIGCRVSATLVFEAGLSPESAQVRVRNAVVELPDNAEIDRRRDELVTLVRGIDGVSRVKAPGLDLPAEAQRAPHEHRIADIMVPISGYPHVHEHHTIRETLGAIGGSAVALKDGHLVAPRYVLVFDRTNALVGLASRRDLLRGLGETYQQKAMRSARDTIDRMVPIEGISEEMGDDWVSLFSQTSLRNAGEPVSSVMNPIQGAVELTDDLSHVVSTMFKLGIDLVPVLDKGRAVGVVLMTDVFDLVAEFLAENAGS